ncbi:MAG: dienelactone hydrolase family protein [Verrucomicrobiales bacterium]
MKYLAAILLAPATLSAELVEKTVEFEHEGTVLEGFQVYDDTFEGKRPGVLVVHQWTGLGEHEKERSRMLAKLGYQVFATDIYGKGVRPQPPAAGQEAGKYKGNRALFRERLAAGLAVLKADEKTDPERLGAIGFCFGGTAVLEMARAGMDVDGVVSFHGGLGAAEGMEAREGEVKAEILVCHGAIDPHVPTEEVKAFGKEMTEAGASWQLNAYSGAVHSFTQKSAGDDPSKGVAYHEKADRRSWEAMKDFFAEVLAE